MITAAPEIAITMEGGMFGATVSYRIAGGRLFSTDALGRPRPDRVLSYGEQVELARLGSAAAATGSRNYGSYDTSESMTYTVKIGATTVSWGTGGRPPQEVTTLVARVSQIAEREVASAELA
jgi:hypothetical protein